MELNQAGLKSLKIMANALKITAEKNCRDCCSKCPLKRVKGFRIYF